MPAESIPFGFAGALELLKQGMWVTCLGWNGKEMYLGLQVFDENSVNKVLYIWIMFVDCKRVPWVAIQTDLLSIDWVQCPKPPKE